MTNIPTDGKQYLAKMRKHICIVGKFWIARNDDDKILYRTFANAKEDFDLRLYATKREITVNNSPLEVPGLVLPRDAKESDRELKFPEAFDKAADEARQKSESKGHSLEGSVRDRAEHIGGRLFVDLLNALDAVMPFSHPNFDRLLSAAFCDYVLWKSRYTDTYFTHHALQEFVAHPAVNQRLVGYIRNAPDDSEKQIKFIKTFKRAAGEAAKLTQFSLSETNLDILAEHLCTFQAWLRQEDADLYDAQHYLLTGGVKNWTLPSHPSFSEFVFDKSVSDKHAEVAHVRNLFKNFDHASRKIQELLACEPLLSLMGFWALCRFGKDDGTMAATMGKEYFDIEKATDEGGPFFSNQEAEILRNELKRTVAEKTKRDDFAEQAIAEAFQRRVEFGVRTLVWKRTYEEGDLREHSKDLFVKLVVLLTEGLTEKLEAAEKLTKKFCTAFMAYQTEIRKLSQLESGELERKLREALGRETYGELEEWLGGLCKEAEEQKWRTEEIARRFQDGFLSHLSRRVGEMSGEFIEENGKAIAEAKNAATEAYAIVLDAMKSNRDGVPEAAPGASLGVVDLLSTKEDDREREDDHSRLDRTKDLAEQIITKLSEENKEGEQGKQRQKMASGSQGRGKQSTVIQKAVEEIGNKGYKFSEGEEFSVDVLKVLREIFDKEEKWETSELKGPQPKTYAEQHRKVQQILQSLLGEDENDVDLTKDTKYARERGIMRALLVGSYILALPAEKTVLSLKDRSVVAQLIFRMVEFVGATPDWDQQGTPQGAEGTKRRREDLLESEEDLSRKQENGSNEATGVRDMPWEHIFPIPPNSGKHGIDMLEKALMGCTSTAVTVVRAHDALEEKKGLDELFGELEKCGEGQITIINETLKEHIERMKPDKQRILAVPMGTGSAPFIPPSVCYVTRLAAAKPEQPTSLEPLLKSLFKDKNAPLGEGARYKKLPDRLALLGMPVFVGPKLEQTQSGDKGHKLPILSFEGVDAWQAVMCLAGLSSRESSFWSARITEAREDDFIHRAKKFSSERADIISEVRRLGGAWYDVLVGDVALAEQFWSRFISWGLWARATGQMKAGIDFSNAQFVSAAVGDVLDDLKDTHENWDESPNVRDDSDRFRPRFGVQFTDDGGKVQSKQIPRGVQEWKTLELTHLFVGDMNSQRKIFLKGLAALSARI